MLVHGVLQPSIQTGMTATEGGAVFCQKNG